MTPERVVSLLDVNVLVALLDPMHVHHEAAHEWFGASRGKGWATCPITENGLVRIIASAAYPGSRTTVADAIERLAVFKASGDHVFWPDLVSLDETVETRHVQGPGQITDIYLLALAVDRRGRLTTFDRGIAIAAVKGARPHHVLRLGASSAP